MPYRNKRMYYLPLGKDKRSYLVAFVQAGETGWQNYVVLGDADNELFNGLPEKYISESSTDPVDSEDDLISDSSTDPVDSENYSDSIIAVPLNVFSDDKNLCKRILEYSK